MDQIIVVKSGVEQYLEKDASCMFAAFYGP